MRYTYYGFSAIGIFVFGLFMSIILSLAVSLLLAWPLSLLWNWLMPLLFSLPPITFWQAFGMQVLCWLLFGHKVTFNSKSNTSES